MLQLVLGPSGSGKSNYLLERIEERARAGQRSLLLVPEQFTSSTESRIYARLGDEYSGRVESYSFTSLAEKLLNLYGGAAVRTLTDAGRAVLVRRALESMGDAVHYYSRHRRSTAFCEKCAETLNELKSAGVSAAQLEQLAEGAGPSGEKLRELAGVYAAYQALLEGAAMDPTDRVAAAAERLEPDFFADAAVFIDEFDTFNAPKRRMLERMLQCAPSITVALCADGLEDREGGLGLFSGAKKMAGALRAMARENGVAVASPVILTEDKRHKNAPDLARLAALLAGAEPEPGPADPAQLTLLRAEDRQTEAKLAAAAAAKLARAGVPYSKMAVICRDASQYLAAVRYEFRLAGIPLFFDEPASAEHAAPLRLVKALLSLLRRGVSTETVLAVAKTGLTSLSEAQLCALENYAYTWQLSAAQWQQPFTLSPAGFGGEMRPAEAEQLALAESARQALAPLLANFALAARKKPAAALCESLYRTMLALGAEEKLTASAAKLKEEEGIPAAEEAVRVWDLAADLLDQMALLLGEETLPPAEYGELFDLLARTTDLGHIPQSLNAVIFTTAGRMRLDEPDYCFVLGLGEGEFPAAPGDRGLLTHAERDALIRQGVEMPDCFENRMVREQVCFYKALTAASKGVWMSWASGPAALPMTSALTEAKACLDPAAPALETADLAATPAAALDLLGESWDAQSPATAALFAAVEGSEAGKAALAPLRRAVSREPFAVQDTGAMHRLLGDHMRLSPSRMERYYSCPFAYFLEYVLGARPRKQAALTADQTGTLVHYILEQALKRAGEDFVDLSETELAELAAAVAREYVAANMPGAGARFEYLIRRLQKSAAALLAFIQAEQRQGSFRPVAFELGIGDGPEAVPSVVLTTKTGETVRMVGKIDRVDACREGGKTWLRVVDYKTGSKEFLLEDVRRGLNCQMLVYLFTLVRNAGDKFENPAPAGVLYLMADPAPARGDRAEAAQGLDYKVEGVVVGEPEVLSAMDSAATGLYVPVRFDKAGQPRLGEALTSVEELAKLQGELDDLVVKMAEELYAGKIAAEPLAAGRKQETHCRFCDYRNVCRRQE
ncbi:MAG TPA: PD-(D/E)XK nuclease family protein [Candidatus Fournierella merdipullorum]|uniref:PD-(D/E)XK nuclease family protein n=1 Tax=Candidatus Allofournierella merdipullorum TaxID=2838595 RepID=A0A9D2E329_9FIRM|nr:PD-(D/E)XK nuclease family protein [Candidatus Fournierella merdipullorum]